jgi:PAS domain S-box-containing protein
MEPEGFDDHVTLLERGGLQAALAAAETGTWRWSIASGVVRWDATLEALCGLGHGEFGGTFEAWLDTLHPEDRDDVVALIQGALDRRIPYRFEHRTVWPDGTLRWLECRGEVLTNDEGEAVGTVGCAVDVTSRKLAELEQAALLDEVRGSAGRLRALQQLSRQLAGALAVEDVVATVLEELVVPATSAVRALWLLDTTDRELVLAGERGMTPGAAEAVDRIQLDQDLPGAIAVRERRTIVSPSQSDSLQRFPELKGIPRAAMGFIAVPLLVDSEVMGVLALGYDGPLEEADVAFLEAAGGNIAQTLERVRLAESLEERSQEVSFLADITRAAITATDHRELMLRIARTAVPRLGDVCTLHFVAEPGAATTAVAAHADPERTRLAEALLDRFSYDPAAERGVANVLRSGHVEFVPSIPNEMLDSAVRRNGKYDHRLAEVLDELRPTSAITVPIAFEGRIIGALQVLVTGERPRHTRRDVTMTRAVAARIGDALQNRWLTDQHRHISSSLQRAFLPPILRSIPGLDTASAYWPAGTATEVGGDFYDLFAIGDRKWAVLIGDACGTGPDAAATAAIARHTARAAARHGLGHQEVLQWVNEAVMHSDRNLFCTACYATLEVDGSGEDVDVTVAVGGHPLPILLRGDRAEALGLPGTLLGVFDDAHFEVRHDTLGSGDAIVLYTDGLTDLPPPHARTPEELHAMLGAAAPSTASDIIDVLRRDLDARRSVHQRADDTAMLVIRNTGTSSGAAPADGL